MQGILKLREIIENDPENIDASWYLGLFSIQTGQYEKAIERLEMVARKDETSTYSDVYYHLGESYAALENVEEDVMAGSWNRSMILKSSLGWKTGSRS